MKSELIDKVVKSFDEFLSASTDTLPVAENGEIPLEIKKDNFHQLSMFKKRNLVVAIDGGNAKIISGANFSLHFVRVCGAYYLDKKIVDMKKKEFFCFIRSFSDGSDIKYNSSFFGEGVNEIFSEDCIFGSFFKGYNGECYSLEPSTIGGIVRRYAELKFAKELIKINDCSNGCFVLDGSIQSKDEREEGMIKELISIAESNKVQLGFLSKTCRLLTSKGGSVASYLNEIGPKSSWYYYPIFSEKEGNSGSLYFVRLNSKSNYVFKLDLPKYMNPSCEDYILELSLNSDDPVFYGYPYPLVEADRAARVSNKEKEYMKTLLLSKVSSLDRLRYLLSSVDAHSILDNISF